MRIALAHRDRLVREALRRSLALGDLALIWSAEDAHALARQQRRDPPDLLLLDAALVDAQPGGFLVREFPWFVLADDEGSAGVYEALSAGALGHLQPPHLQADGELIGASRLLARIRRVQALIGNGPLRPPMAVAETARSGHAAIPIIALGASTGGPQALAQVLAGLPAGLPAAVLVVQHIDGDFSNGLVEWLASNSLLPVSLAQRGETLAPGRVYVGAADGHLVLLASQQLAYQTPQHGDLHVPSVDTLFTSLAERAPPGAAALLSGMGNDGARGLLRLRQAGWFTVAQDQASCAVYGMPRAAEESGAVQQSLPPGAIGPALARHIQALGSGGRAPR